MQRLLVLLCALLFASSASAQTITGRVTTTPPTLDVGVPSGFWFDQNGGLRVSSNGGATAARQAAPGTAGSPSTDVTSVQGVVGGVPQSVQPVDGFQPGGTAGYSQSSPVVLFTQDMTGYPSISVQITSIGSGNAVTYEESNDNVTWASKVGSRVDNAGAAPDSPTDTTTVLREFVVASRYFRARISTYGSGTVTVVPTLRIGMPSARSIYINGAVPLQSQLSGSSATGGLALTSRIASSAASTNCTLVKASAGRNYKITGFNTTASAKFIKFYNAATAPTAGSGTVIYNRALPPGAFSYDWADIGYYHSIGIGFCITGAAPDADTTALAAGDIVAINVDYQ